MMVAPLSPFHAMERQSSGALASSSEVGRARQRSWSRLILKIADTLHSTTLQFPILRRTENGPTGGEGFVRAAVQRNWAGRSCRVV